MFENLVLNLKKIFNGLDVTFQNKIRKCKTMF